ncbi:MAG: tetratricopeptide repeat protein [Bacteroidales bacterium]|nr:tetratricopeptide repeat protein [Bacteroidales bacterium]MBQ6688080.1 tetratricopeptide repeat protein [Bacteroidales bacterium]
MAKEIKNENAEAIVEAVSKTEKFFNENGKLLGGIVMGIVVVAVAVFCWFRFAYQPSVEEAQGQMALAEENFRNGDFELALNGDGNELGFVQILDEYGTKAGMAVYFYAGVCELQLGNWESAISYLSSYKGKDGILSARAKACIGDAYIGLENYSKALEYFEAAAETIDNIYAAGYLLKAGVTAEKLGENAKALSFYKKIKDQYPQSREGYNIDKYIGRLEAR